MERKQDLPIFLKHVPRAKKVRRRHEKLRYFLQFIRATWIIMWILWTINWTIYTYYLDTGRTLFCHIDDIVTK